ncbi:hypothetical protein SAMN05216559_0259 [Halomicrobium zhouii]|uniref:Uncharacterized protein n=1 Tax=Halomicrobium zhouii TaxID=767519 RepID=A0A1I6K682_9EURY|nr:hypothetical protein SAMN05216559_0259 [Halomicrobium zhouii]
MQLAAIAYMDMSQTESKTAAFLESHPKLLGALFMALVLLTQAGAAAGAIAGATAGP